MLMPSFVNNNSMMSMSLCLTAKCKGVMLMLMSSIGHCTSVRGNKQRGAGLLPNATMATSECNLGMEVLTLTSTLRIWISNFVASVLPLMTRMCSGASPFTSRMLGFFMSRKGDGGGA
ncbi:hypothetical protein CY35_01G154900 [Sphagnum magellanicum]|nr:hypothetical protein CY35_01G154900 [Sphagnum magellanicum]